MIAGLYGIERIWHIAAGYGTRYLDGIAANKGSLPLLGLHDLVNLCELVQDASRLVFVSVQSAKPRRSDSGHLVVCNVS